MPKVVLTGARGQLGRAFQDFFRTHGIVFIPMYWDSFSLEKMLEKLAGTDYLINCAAFSGDRESLKHPYKTFESNVWGVVKQLEILRQYYPKIKYVNFGSIYEDREDTPYATSKVCSGKIIKCYRDNYKLWAIQPTLGYVDYYGGTETRLVQKIVKAATKIALDIENGQDYKPLELYNIDDEYKFAFAVDVVESVWSALQQETPFEPLYEGDKTTVRKLAETAFRKALGRDNVHWWQDEMGTEYFGCNESYYIVAKKRFPTKISMTTPITFDSINKEEWNKLIDSIQWKFKTGVEDMVGRLVDYEKEKKTK